MGGYIVKKLVSLLLVALLFFLTSRAETCLLIPGQDENGLYGYVNENGDWIISPQFSYAECFRGNYASVTIVTDCSGKEERNVSGIIDRDGSFVLEPEYEIRSGFYEGWGSFGSWDGGYYVIGKSGDDNNGPFFFEDLQGPLGFFDVRSGFFSGLKYEDIWDTSVDGTLIPIFEEREHNFYLGYADRETGEITIPCQYYTSLFGEVASFPENVASMAIADTLADIDDGPSPEEIILVNAHGEQIPLPEGIVLIWENQDLINDRIPVFDLRTQLMGYADSKGNVVIEPQYACAFGFENGLARVDPIEGPSVMIDTSGSVVCLLDESPF